MERDKERGKKQYECEYQKMKWDLRLSERWIFQSFLEYINWGKTIRKFVGGFNENENGHKNI